jgi:hypothetical protein
VKGIYKLLAVSCLLLPGCAGSPEEYRLTNQQIAWQGYQAGQVLRFTQRPGGPVRTYRITSVDDRMERQTQGINFTVFLPRRDIDCQHVTVSAQRTDTTGQVTVVLDFELNYYAGSIDFRPTIGWENFEAYKELPLDSINKGVAFDSLRYPGVRLLPTAAFGGVTYTPVLQIAPDISGSTPAKGALQMLYYAKGTGVVAFGSCGRARSRRSQLARPPGYPAEIPAAD